MAMNVGSARPGADPDVMMDINTTPLIDVMLVLLVMLIITIPIQLHSVNLNMPVGNPPPPLIEPVVLKIDIDDASRIFWNGELVNDRADLESRLTQAAAQQPQPEMHLRPDQTSARSRHPPRGARPRALAGPVVGRACARRARPPGIRRCGRSLRSRRAA